MIESMDSNPIVKAHGSKMYHFELFRGLSQITFAPRVGRWSEKHVVYYIKSAN